MKPKLIIIALSLMNLALLGLISAGFFSQNVQHTDPVGNELRLDLLIPVSGTETFQPGSVATLFVFFHADGTCHCLDDWSNWVKASKDLGPDLSVIGIFNGHDLDKYRDFAAGLDFPFPLFQDPTHTLHDQLKVTRNQIVKILVDNQGNVVYQDSNAGSEKDQKEFFRRLCVHVDTLNH